MSINKDTNITINIVILVTLIMFCLGGIALAVNWKDVIENRIQSNCDKVETVMAENEQIIKRGTARDLMFTELNTDYEWVKASLIRIEAAIKEK